MTLREVSGRGLVHGHDVTEHSAPQPAQTDLGSLVDRLIAARDVSGSTRVGASIAHADFGRIDLSFAPDGSGMTVGMHSRDPDFAPSVQAAASLAPSPAPTDSNSGQSTSGQAASNPAGSSGMEAGANGSNRDHARNSIPEPQLPERAPRVGARRPADRGDAGGVYA
jgi:hypothetical protein